MTAISLTPVPELGTAELYFASGMPGFPAARSFSVKPWGDQPTPFLVLECRDIIGLRFVAVGPQVFFPWYEPRFAAEVYQSVDIAGPDAAVVLVILTLHATAEQTTANLLGPVLVNTATGQAVQAVLSGSGYSSATPIVTRP
jgi:flagellar assembly factor FliW